MAEHRCIWCKKPLRGMTDTFGPPQAEECWDCYAEINAGPGQPYYGLAPHHHDLTKTGSLIGSTVLDALPAPAEDGGYDLGYAMFYPDPDAPGCGVYEPKPLPGWS